MLQTKYLISISTFIDEDSYDIKDFEQKFVQNEKRPKLLVIKARGGGSRAKKMIFLLV